MVDCIGVLKPLAYCQHCDLPIYEVRESGLCAYCYLKKTVVFSCYDYLEYGGRRANVLRVQRERAELKQARLEAKAERFKMGVKLRDAKSINNN